MEPIIQWLGDRQAWMALAAVLLFGGAEVLAAAPGAVRRHGARWAGNLTLYLSGVAAALALTPALIVLRDGADRLAPFPHLSELGLPIWAQVFLAVLLIDLIAYLTHLLSHQAPPLWRLHRTHHADQVVDASTAVRHHPAEVLWVTALQLSLFAVLGLPWVAAVIYGIAMTGLQAAQHSTMRLPEPADRALRLVFVTPGMHRVHHSERLDEGNSNFGQLLSVWDRLFGTYVRRQSAERTEMTLGVEGFEPGAGVWRPLLEPLRSTQYKRAASGG